MQRRIYVCLSVKGMKEVPQFSSNRKCVTNNKCTFQYTDINEQYLDNKLKQKIQQKTKYNSEVFAMIDMIAIMIRL